MAKRSVTAEDLYDIELLTDLQLSPDGKHIIYSVQRVDRGTEKKYQNLWLVPTRGGRARQFTYGDQNDYMPRWSPDGSQIAFLSNRGDERQPQIYLIPFSGGEARPLTSMKGVFAGYVWSPDGSQMAALFRKPDDEQAARAADPKKEKLGVVARHYTRRHYKADAAGYLPHSSFHIWTINAKTGKGKQLLDDDFYSEGMPSWSPDGETLIFSSNRHDNPDDNPDAATLYTIPAAGGALTEIEIDNNDASKGAPSYSPDGKWISFIGRKLPRHFWQNPCIYVVPAGGGSAKNLTHDYGQYVGSNAINDLGGGTPLNAPRWAGDSESIYFVTSHHGGQPLLNVDLNGNVTTVHENEGVVGAYTFAQDEKLMAYFEAGSELTPQVALLNRSTGKSKQLTRLNAAFQKRAAQCKIEETWIKTADGTDLQGWIMFPPDFDPSKTYPSILEIHGGPQAMYGRFIMHEFLNFACNGYIVYYTNPRGSQGYGEDHCRAIYSKWGSVDYEDLMAWADYVHAKPYIDTNRLGVTGGSYGGYMTAWIIGQTQRFQAAAAQRVLVNYISMYGSADFNHFTEELGGLETVPWVDVDKYWKHSPLKHIGNATTPTLVIHSEQDFRTPQEQGEQLYVALHKMGVDTEFVLFPGESHGLSRGGRTDRRIARLDHMVRWFDKYLK